MSVKHKSDVYNFSSSDRVSKVIKITLKKNAVKKKDQYTFVNLRVD